MPRQPDAAAVPHCIAGRGVLADDPDAEAGQVSRGRGEIGLGDALGSKVVNVALILALALLASEIQSPRDSVAGAGRSAQAGSAFLLFKKGVNSCSQSTASLARPRDE